MAGVDVLCLDKTGTIAKSEITVGDVKAFRRFKVEDVLLAGILASHEEGVDPIDDAIISHAKVSGKLWILRTGTNQ